MIEEIKRVNKDTPQETSSGRLPNKGDLTRSIKLATGFAAMTQLLSPSKRGNQNIGVMKNRT